MPREQERVPYLIEAVLEFASAKHAARISDLSAGGCYIDSIVQVREGESVTFEIPTPSDEKIKFSGEVAYVLEGSGFGLKFRDLTDVQKAYIDRMMGSHQLP
jgi:hypothetical protein